MYCQRQQVKLIILLTCPQLLLVHCTFTPFQMMKICPIKIKRKKLAALRAAIEDNKNVELKIILFLKKNFKTQQTIF